MANTKTKDTKKSILVRKETHKKLKEIAWKTGNKLEQVTDDIINFGLISTEGK